MCLWCLGVCIKESLLPFLYTKLKLKLRNTTMNTSIKIMLIACFIQAIVISVKSMPTPELELNSHKDIAYVDAYDDVTRSVHPMTSQFCKRGAALILLGRAETAEQYMEDFGSCIRRAVQRTNNLSN